MAHGIVQDRSGKVIKRFKVDILASWKDDIATLGLKSAIADNKTHYIKVSQKKGTEYIHSVFKHLGDGVYQRVSGAIEIKDTPV